MGVVDVASNAEATPPHIARVAEAMEEIMQALLACKREGVEPADALRAVGVNIPSVAAPMLNMMFRPETTNAPEGASADATGA